MKNKSNILHVRIGPEAYHLLESLERERKETISKIVRSMLYSSLLEASENIKNKKEKHRK